MNSNIAIDYNAIIILQPPLSVNDAWRGRRFKTDKYKNYEKILLLTLPLIRLPKKPYKIMFEFGFSNPASDIDNPTKTLLDIMQKRYKFNDKDVYRLEINKVIVKKGFEYSKFEIQSL